MVREIKKGILFTLVTMVLLLAVFGISSVLFWAYFRFRPQKPGAEPPTSGWSGSGSPFMNFGWYGGRADSVISTRPSFALSDATMKSAASASSSPPPTA